MKLTVKQLKDMQPGIFASGRVACSLNKFIAVRGQIGDWAIYVGLRDIRDHGDKVYEEKVIRELVPCTDAAFKLYRY